MQTTKTFISSQCDAAAAAQADLHFLSRNRTTTTTARSAQILIQFVVFLLASYVQKTGLKLDLNLVRQQDC